MTFPTHLLVNLPLLLGRGVLPQLLLQDCRALPATELLWVGEAALLEVLKRKIQVPLDMG